MKTTIVIFSSSLILLSGCASKQDPCAGTTGLDRSACGALGFQPSGWATKKLFYTPSSPTNDSYHDSSEYWNNRVKLDQMRSDQEEYNRRQKEMEQDLQQQRRETEKLQHNYEREIQDMKIRQEYDTDPRYPSYY